MPMKSLMLKIQKYRPFFFSSFCIYGESHTLWDLELERARGPVHCRLWAQTAWVKTTLMNASWAKKTATGGFHHVRRRKSSLPEKKMKTFSPWHRLRAQGRHDFPAADGGRNSVTGLGGAQDASKKNPSAWYELFPV